VAVSCRAVDNARVPYTGADTVALSEGGTEAMVHVRLMPLLAQRSTSRTQEIAFPFRSGCTPAAILLAEGFPLRDQEAITAVVNGSRADLEQPLADGDQIEFVVAIRGGANPGDV